MRKHLALIYTLVALILIASTVHSGDKPEAIANNAGIAYLDEGDFSSAEKKFKESIRINPNYPDAYANLGIVLWVYDKYEEAEEVLLKAISLKEDEPNSHMALAYVYRSQGRCEEAIVEMKQYVSLARKQGSIDEAGHDCMSMKVEIYR